MTKGALSLALICSVLPLYGDQVIASGSSFAVGTDGYILTNAHVVAGCARIIATAGGAELATQTIATDPQNDLALLKIARRFSVVLVIRDRARVQLGEPVIAFGYPLQGVISTSLNMTTGNVSSLSGLGDDARSFQFTAPIQPGNSGGPLVDAAGNVVGIVTSKLSPLWAARNIGDLPQNVNFALRTSVIQGFLESRGVDYRSGGLSAAVSVADLTSKASETVLPLQCIGAAAEVADARVRDGGKEDVAQIMEAASRYLRNEMLNEAEAHLRAGIEKYEFDPDLREELAKLMIRTGRQDAATSQLRTVIKLSPESWEASALLGALLIQQRISGGPAELRAEGLRIYDELLGHFATATRSLPSSDTPKPPPAAIIDSWKTVVGLMRDPSGEWTAVLAGGTAFEKTRSFKVIANTDGTYSTSPNEVRSLMGASQEQIENYFAFVPWDLDFRMSSPQTGFSALSSYSNGQCGFKQSAEVKITADGSVMVIAGKVIELTSVSLSFERAIGRKKAGVRHGSCHMGVFLFFAAFF
jgi:hypothetical protein